MKFVLSVLFIPLFCIAEPMKLTLDIENVGGNTCTLSIGSDSVHLVAKKERITKSEWGNYAKFPAERFKPGEREENLFHTDCAVALSDDDIVGRLKFCALASSSETQLTPEKYKIPYSVSNCNSAIRGDGFVFTASIISDDRKKSLSPMTCSFMCLVE